MLRRRAEEPFAQPRDRGRGRRRAAGLDPGGVASRRGAATSPIANTAAPPVLALPCGVERAQRFGAHLGHAVRAGDQDRRPHRRRHQDRPRRSPRPGLASSTRVTAAGRCAAVGRGEDRERDPGGVGGGVVAADPGRVLGREGGIAELGRRLAGCGRAALVLRAGRRRPAAPRRRRAAAAAAAEDRGDDEDRGEEDRAADQLQRQRRRPSRRFRGWLRCGRSSRPLAARGGHLGVDRLLSGHSGKLQAETGWPVG